MNKIKVSVIILSINVIMLFFLNNIIAQDKIKCIKIGKAIWMVENLNVDHFRNGDTIL